MYTNISAAILAGGPGSRMDGLIKSNIMVAGETILARTLSVIGDLFKEIIIVTNKKAEFAGFHRCKITGDIFVGAGPLGGIHAAINASSAEAVFVFAGDMPLLSRELICMQTELFLEQKCDILVPRVNTSIEPLHSIYSRALITRLGEYLSSGRSCAVRDFFITSDVRYLELNKDEEIQNIFSNINTPSDIDVAEGIINNSKL